MVMVKRLLGIFIIMALLVSIAPVLSSVIPNLAQDAAGDCTTCSDSAGEGKAEGIPNPAAAYCKQLGYQYEIQEDEEGNEYGVCILPDGSEVDAWDFYNGECGQEYSYCAQQGYDIRTERVDKGSYSTECAVCVSRRGAEEEKIPMPELMEKNGEALFVTESYEINEVDTGQECIECEAMKVEGISKDQPAAFDWRDVDGHTYIGPVRDQGGCGSCYAFGAAASAEGVYNWATGNYDGNCADFSESFIIWCLGRILPYSSHFFGCGGADYDYYELLALTVEGISDESDFPYTETDPGSCTHWGDPTTVFASWSRIDCNDIDAIKTAIMTYGVIDAAVYVTTDFQDYSGGIYTDSYTSCGTTPCYYTPTNHAISLVGWGHDATEGDYWILRNSWGDSWGEGGYMRIAVTSARVACEATYLVYTAVEPDIWVSPASFLDITLPPDTTWNDTLEIGNDGTSILTYNITDTDTTPIQMVGGSKITTPESVEIIEHGNLIELSPSEPVSFPSLRTATSEIAYDDGVSENAWAWNYAGDLFAVRFTPPEYPADLDVARISLWPDAPDTDHEQFAVDIYDDDGVGGLPGTLLGSVNTTATAWGWWDVDISALGITITEGDFYVAYHQLTDSPDCEALCIDETDPDGRSWLRLSGTWSQLPYDIIAGDWMIRCVVDIPEDDCTWLDESPASGLITPGNSDEITVSIDTTGLAEGDYSAEIVIANNDPDENPTIVLVTLTVGAVADTTPPYTSGHAPADTATDVPIDTNIVVHVLDDGDGVDIATIVMTVEGAPVTPVITGDPADYTLTYDPPGDFAYLQVVDVTVDAYDLAGTPNAMTQDVYSFTTEAEPNNPPDVPTSPLCEGETNPTGVTDTTPELGWTFADPDGGDTQGAYQILVASSSANLALDTGDMWDSGKVAGSDSEVSYAGAALVGGQTYYWKVKTWDNLNAEGPYCAEQEFTTFINTPPTAPEVDVTPDLPLLDDDLVCTVTTISTDIDGDTVYYTYEWYKNNVLQSDETTSTTDLTDTVSSTLTAKNEVWRCVVTPDDGTGDGTPAEDQVVIDNTPPTVPEVDVTPDLPLTDDNLVCTVTTESTDADSDTVTYTYEWYKDGVLQPAETTATTALTDTVSSALIAKGETWRCVVTPDDGFANGLSDEDQVTIGNTPPLAPVVDVTPDLPLTDDDLVCTVTTISTDIDGDTVYYTYEWYKDGVPQPAETTTTTALTDTVSSALIAKGETWRCVVTPDDRFANGLSDEDQVTIGNTPPLAPIVDVTPDLPLTDDDLVCTITTVSTDADNDTVTYTYEWYKDGVPQPAETTTTTALTDTVSSALIAKGETWRCVVTPNDGFANGLSDEDQVTIGNTPPPAPAVNITPDLPLTDDDLVCTITTPSDDADGDPVTYAYQWYKNGLSEAGETTATMSLATAAGETWKCVVTPNDGTVDGPTAEDQTIIVETLTTGTITDDTLDALTDADTEVVVTGSAEVTVAKYAGNPGASFNGDIGKHIDVYIESATPGTEIEIRLYYKDAEIAGKTESSLTLQWWNGTAWATCSDTGVETVDIPPDYSGYIRARINAGTTPSLDDLTGTPFGGAGSTPPSGGGGGGGGGMPEGVTFVFDRVNHEGKFIEDIIAQSWDKMVTLTIKRGTIGRTWIGGLISWVSIKPAEEHPIPPANTSIVTGIYDITPSGATFEPSSIIMFQYNPADIPDGVDELDLFIATLDEQTGQWVRLESHVDPENHTVSAEIYHLSPYAVMAGTKPADISVAGLNVMPQEIYEGDDATATAKLVNSGDFTGTYEAILRINNTIRETKEVDIAGNDSVDISFDLAGLEYGTYQITVGEVTKILTVLEVIVPPTPAAFTTSSLEISPDEVDIGEDVNISVRVENTGETEGVCQLVCKVNGVVVDEKEITLTGGSGESVVFTTTFDEAGNKTIEVNELTGSLGVKEVVVEEEPSPDPGTITEAPFKEIQEEPAPESRWWIVGLVVGVCAVIIAGVIFYNKRRRSVS